jgi:hypothetical protein
MEYSDLSRNDGRDIYVWFTDGNQLYRSVVDSFDHQQFLKQSNVYSEVSRDEILKAIKANKLDYIGGTPHEARVKFWNKYPELV